MRNAVRQGDGAGVYRGVWPTLGSSERSEAQTKTSLSGGKAKTLGFNTSSFVMVYTSKEKILGCILLSAFESEVLKVSPKLKSPTVPHAMDLVCQMKNRIPGGLTSFPFHVRFLPRLRQFDRRNFLLVPFQRIFLAASCFQENLIMNQTETGRCR